MVKALFLKTSWSVVEVLLPSGSLGLEGASETSMIFGQLKLCPSRLLRL